MLFGIRKISWQWIINWFEKLKQDPCFLRLIKLWVKWVNTAQIILLSIIGRLLVTVQYKPKVVWTASLTRRARLSAEAYTVVVARQLEEARFGAGLAIAQLVALLLARGVHAFVVTLFLQFTSEQSVVFILWWFLLDKSLTKEVWVGMSFMSILL